MQRLCTYLSLFVFAPFPHFMHTNAGPSCVFVATCSHLATLLIWKLFFSCFRSSRFCMSSRIRYLLAAVNCCYRGRVVTPKWYVSVLSIRQGHVASSSSVIAFVAAMQLCRSAIRTNTVWHQLCCLSRASDVMVVVSGPSMVSVVFRVVRSWSFCSSGFWLRLCVARFWLADVGSCLVGRYHAGENDYSCKR